MSGHYSLVTFDTFAKMDDKDVQKFTKLKDQLSEEDKQGNVGKVISYVATLINGGWSFRNSYKNISDLKKMDQYVKNIESLFEGLKKGESCKEKVLNAIDQNRKNCTEAFSNFDFCHERLYEDVSNGKITEIEKVKEQILEGFANHRQQESNKLIADMVKGNALVAACQLLKIYIAWKKISEASNVINDSDKFNQINKNLNRMKEMVSALVKLCDENPADKSIDRRMTKINSLFTSTLSKISDIRVTIEGHIQRLDLLGDHAAVDTVINFATAASQGFQVWSAWENLDSLNKICGTVSVAMFTFFGMANVKTFIITQDKLKDLRKDLKEVNRLKEALDDLRDEAEKAIGDI